MILMGKIGRWLWANDSTPSSQAREVGYDGPIYAETISVGTTALDIAGDAATGMKAITADLDPDNPKAGEVLTNFRERYNYVTVVKMVDFSHRLPSAIDAV